MGKKRIVFDEDGEVIEESEDEAGESPVENASDCPLFPNANKRTTRHIDHLSVEKLDAPNDGFKGNLPMNASKMDIAVRWGNGHFKINGINGKGASIRHDKLTIALSTNELRSIRKGQRAQEEVENDETPQARPSNGGGDDIARLAMHAQHNNHKEEVERLANMANRVNEEVSRQGKEYVAMVTHTHDNQTEKDRTYYKVQNAQQQTFFSQMHQQSEQAHVQSMAMQQENFKQTMLMMQSLQVQQAQANNPAVLVTMLMKGLEMGQGMDSDEPDWLKALSAGGGMMKDLAGMAQLKGVAVPKTLPNPSAPTNGAKTPILTKEQIQSVAEFKLICDAKGVPFDTIVENAKQQVAGGLPPDDDEWEDVEDDEESENGKPDDASTQKPADVDGEKPNEQPPAT